MKIRYLGTAAEGWPALFCFCPVCTHAQSEDWGAQRGILAAYNGMEIDF